MPSFFARLRNRAISQSTSGSAQSAASPSTPDTNFYLPDATAFPPASFSTQRRTAEGTPINRKILPDISGLLDSYSAEIPANQGLRPPRPRKRSVVEAFQAPKPTSGGDSVAGRDREEDLAHTSAFAPDRLSARGSTSNRRAITGKLSPDSGGARAGSAAGPHGDQVGHSGNQDEKLGSHSSQSEAGGESARASPDSFVSGTSGTRFSRISKRMASVGAWSTFGRTNEHVSPRLTKHTSSSSGIPSHMASVDSLRGQQSLHERRKLSKRFGSFTSLNRNAVVSRTSSNIRPSGSVSSTLSKSFSFKYAHDDHAKRTPSPHHTTSSRQNSTHRSATTRSSRSIQSQLASASASASHHIGLESPRTFGNPTPPPARSSSFQSANASPPPPLPPLVHPELIAALSSRPKPSLPNISDNHHSRWDPSRDGRTYPPRRRRKTLGDSDSRDANTVPFPDRSSTFSRSLRAYASLPRVRPSSRPELDRLRTRRSSSSSRSRIHSSRRSSAEWNAHQATTGVTSAAAAAEHGWPAEVSREILRMSLGESAMSVPTAQTSRRTSASAEHAGRVKHVASTIDAAVSCSLGLLPTPITPSYLPDSLGSPILLEDHLRGDPHTRHHGDTPGTRSRSGNVVEVGSRMAGKGNGSSTLPKDDNSPSVFKASTLPRTPNNRASHKSILMSTSPTYKLPSPGPSSLHRSQSLDTTPTKMSSTRSTRFQSEPGLMAVPETPTNTKGKRKAEDVDLTPPDLSKNAQRATFVIPEDGRRSHHVSESSRAPSSYHRKRARLSTTSSPSPSPNHSRPGSVQKAPNTPHHDRERGPATPTPHERALSRATSTRSIQHQHSTPDRRRSMSEISIPISALIAPHAPSVTRSARSAYHMRDPRRPPRVRPTSWGLHFKSDEEEGSVMHAWLFFVGFVVFPLWWAASVLPIPETRRVGGTDMEKAVMVDDPQVEHDARSWRFRCRIMSAVSFVTYIPFIVLLAVFVPR